MVRLRYWFLVTMAVSRFCTGAEPNLARDVRRAVASSTLIGHPAKDAIDGASNTYWAAEGTPADPAWIELDWERPTSVEEIVIRRFAPPQNASDISSLEVDAFVEGGWRKVQAIGEGNRALPVLIWTRLPKQTTQKLRIAGLGALVRIAEIEVYAERSSPFLDVRGDAKGNIVGVLTDAFGSKGIPGGIAISGTVAGKPWHGQTQADGAGDFTVAMPVGLTGPITIAGRTDGEDFQRTVDAGDIHQGLVPGPEDEYRLKLNGTWKFRPDPPEGFEKSDFNDASWSEIDVPSHWVMKGFQAEHGIGGYRKSVLIPAGWRRRRIRIAFDGVYSEAEVWCNGVRVGSHTGGATPFQLDITNAARPGASNEIAVLVRETSKASDLDQMSVYADFSLAGIFRSAYVFSVPAVHISRMQSHTEFANDYRRATLVTDITIVNESDAQTGKAQLLLELSGPHGDSAKSDPIAVDLDQWSKAEKRVPIPIENPLPWSAEHPNLYTLTVTLSGGSGGFSQLGRRVGFRETRVRGTQILLNGVPVKLRGTCHHDSHPTMGRAVTPELERQDLLLMKEANLDSLRTSHYPPIPELLDLADELGVYVEEEASFCWVDDSSDLRYAALARQFTSEMVERDMSHPSVIYWSSANESTWGPILSGGERMIRESDPSRPVVGSWSDHFDMEIHHNPITVEAIRRYESHSKPVIWDESLGIFQGIYNDGEELWRDPGYRDYYVDPLVPVWDALWRSKTTQGSFIWAWSDDLFLVPGRASEYGRSNSESHGVDNTYHQTGRGLVGDAPWGVVDGWRRRKPEFWHIKELHSPIKVTTRELPQPVLNQPIRVPVENRYFFTKLSELETRWSLSGHQGTLRVDVEPQGTGAIEIPLAFAVPKGSELELKFIDANGKLVDAATVRIGESSPQTGSRAPGKLRAWDRRNLSDEATVVSGEGFELAFSGRAGLLRYGMVDGQTVLYDQPQIWVLPIDDTLNAFPQRLTWMLDETPGVEASDHQVTVTAKGHYRDLNGVYQTTVANNGDLTVVYDFRYTGPDIRVRELGTRFGSPLALDRLAWKRKGEWTWYPSDHIAALQGSARAHSGHAPGGVPDWPYGEDDSPMGTNAFRSTKRNILSASIEDSMGQGVRVNSDSSQHLRAMVETDRIVIHVNDWFGGTSTRAGEWTENYHDGKLLRTGDHITGKVSLSLYRSREIHANR